VGRLEKLDPLDLLDQPDHAVPLARMAQTVLPDLVEKQVPQDRGARQDHQALQDLQDLLETQDPKVQQDLGEKMVLMVPQDLLAQRVQLDPVEKPGPQDLQDQRVHLALQAILDLLDQQDLGVKQDHRDLQVPLDLQDQ